MPYKHGTYGVFSPSIGSVPINGGTTAIYIGTAPVNLVRGYADKVNEPIKISNLNEAYSKLGYSEDWDNFTLCEVIKVHFNNLLENVGPVVFINVLNPDFHKNATPIEQSISFANGRALIVSDKIILDTLKLSEYVEGTDYEIEYDFNIGRVVITSDTITGSVEVSYYEVSPSSVELTDIIGKATLTGEYEGLGAVNLVYQNLNMIPNVIAAPGYSENKTVYAAMVQAAQKINGHWDAFVNADLPIKQVETIEDAIAWKKNNEYISEFSKVYWPKWQGNDGHIYHLSTLATWRMMLVDAEHDNVPMESVSNKQITSGKQYFGEDSKNKGFDQQQANLLNEKGITTGIFWAGINVIWGPHTAAYDYEAIGDNREIFDNSLRTMEHITNSFQQDWGMTIDEPMTLPLAETIKNREQEKADALKAIGALIGNPTVEFIETENPTENLVQGDFVWSMQMTPTPPFKSGTLKVAYTTDGFESYYSEGGE